MVVESLVLVSGLQVLGYVDVPAAISGQVLDSAALMRGGNVLSTDDTESGSPCVTDIRLCCWLVKL